MPDIQPEPAATGNRISRPGRSEEHTSELQSRQYLVCRLLLEKKKKQSTHHIHVYPKTPVSIVHSATYIAYAILDVSSIVFLHCNEHLSVVSALIVLSMCLLSI